MGDRRKAASLVLLGTITAFWVVGLAAPANAEVFQGKCTGSAAFTDNTTVTESTPLSKVVVVPEKDTVQWAGNINLPAPPNEVPFFGAVSVRLPRFNWAVADWDGDTVEVSDSGAYTYEVPGFVPRGVQLEVTASHTQLGQTCVVAVTMKLAGSPGAAAIISAIGALVFGVATLGAGVKRKVT
ncbi:MAG: hypothetical protein BMS9Abin12_0359 [Acidimicrobiia bacterium]|nr:MAG: hypothetical protein BMS9Abin12_0359 [Acidimicrobiia bacterium]